MPKIAKVLSLILAGYALAIFFAWTTSINYQYTITETEIHKLVDGTFISIPRRTESTSFIINSAPYEELPTIDLFKDSTE